MDGTFSHAWADFDSPVSPAADAADVGINVLPYGEVRAAADYELIPGLTDLDPQQLTSPLLTFWYFAVRPGAAAEFESLITSELKNPHGTAVPHALLRPANGSTEYLLLLPAAKASDTATHAQFVGRLLKASVRDMKGTPLVDHYRTETGRYRSDLSYTPNTNATMGKP